MNAEELIYVPKSELARLQTNAGRTSALGWWVSGFACGLTAAVLLGWAG